MNEIILHRRAKKGLRGLSNIEMRKARLAIARLGEIEWQDLLKDRNFHQLRVRKGEELYSYRSSLRIRLIISRSGENIILIEDIASHDALQRYFNWSKE
ncbi:hypothetical protein IH970_06620 [candidate division KSB1 bacterium]|nr:hypothetical protein [candidate division KSB1 bacterium]